MGNIILNLMKTYGYGGIFLLIAVENIFPPIPSEVILTFGGFLTTITSLNVLGVIISATLGSLVGAIILYYLGYLFKFSESNITKCNEWFLKYGNIGVLVGRCIPIIRSLISIPAGISKMNMFKFIVYTVIGSFLWNTLLVTSGVILGNNWSIVASFLKKYSNIVLFLIIFYILFKLIKIFIKNKCIK